MPTRGPDIAQQVGPGLRADAERNRQRLLVAAREVFSEDGLQASAQEIARRAGVGVATLFRRFPTRDDLVQAVFADKMRAYAAAADTALADPDAWEGFCGFIGSICQMQAADRGFADVVTLTFPTAEVLEAERDRCALMVEELIRRAQADGRLRQDFVHQDVALILMANAGVVNAARDAAPDAWRRVVGYLLQALEVGPDDAPGMGRTPTSLPDPPSHAEMHRTFLRIGGRS